MGCMGSKETTRFSGVDDSVHARIKLEKKRQTERGEVPHAYKPRLPHGLVEQKQKEAEERAAAEEQAATTE